jgi:predicted amidohydrolase
MARIAVAQLTSVPGDVPANVAAHVALIADAAADGADVVVFPELSLTGYELAAIEQDPGLTLASADPRLQPLIDACRSGGLIAVVGAPVDEDGTRLLAAVVLDGDGVREIYGKRHVHSSESHLFTPGDRGVTLDIGGCRLALAVCADSGFPEHAAGCRAAGADAYLVGAFHVDDEDAIAAERMAARARDCGLWVALAEHAGDTGTGAGDACGGSGFWAPGGALVTRLGREAPALAVLDIGA